MNNIILKNMQFVSYAGDKYILLPVIWLASMVYLFLSGYKKEALLMALTAVSLLYSSALKLIFRHERPITADTYSYLGNYSFPSSHTLTYTVFFGYIIYLMFKFSGLPLPLRIISILVSVYFVSLVGVSRVYLGQHYIWDVAAGYFFGIVYLAVLIILDKRL